MFIVLLKDCIVASKIVMIVSFQVKPMSVFSKIVTITWSMSFGSAIGIKNK